ncbi:hypothetical protein J5N97_020559 [Dioscorea zingiberensis]|uniref:Uncharacterized protein n=1 Tax=Dioscorea zingiberensis TaxID=325984 RepID=A0A9D5HDR8_9LILI|nr:hypothetical protein J5N97_020559 [Dioscorea zingiberensis]
MSGHNARTCPIRNAIVGTGVRGGNESASITASITGPNEISTVEVSTTDQLHKQSTVDEHQEASGSAFCREMTIWMDTLITVVAFG